MGRSSTWLGLELQLRFHGSGTDCRGPVGNNERNETETQTETSFWTEEKNVWRKPYVFFHDEFLWIWIMNALLCGHRFVLRSRESALLASVLLTRGRPGISFSKKRKIFVRFSDSTCMKCWDRKSLYHNAKKGRKPWNSMLITSITLRRENIQRSQFLPQVASGAKQLIRNTCSSWSTNWRPCDEEKRKKRTQLPTGYACAGDGVLRTRGLYLSPLSTL